VVNPADNEGVRSTAPVFAIVGLLLGLPIDSGAVPPSLPRLVPEPRSLTLGAGYAQLSARWEIVLVDSNAVDADAAAGLVEDVRTRFGWDWRVTSTPTARNIIAIANGKVSASLPNPEQAYTLEVSPTHIELSAPTAQGRYYGIQTLRQLVRGATAPRLPCMAIEDSPELKWRGVSDDISRGQMSTISNFEEIIAHLAYYKINLYGLYLEDVLARGYLSTGLTASDLERIARAAERHHVTVVPILQCFGNNPMVLEGYASPWFRNAPWLERSLSPRSPTGLVSPLPSSSTRALLATIDTLTAHLSSPWLNIGGDELFTFGLEDPRPVANDGSTHLELAHYLADQLTLRYRRVPMIYGDVLAKPLVMDRLRRDVVVVDWNDDPDQSYASIQRLHDAGFERVFVNSGLWTWNTFYPDFDRAFRNVAAFTDTGKAHGIMGAFAASRGENGSENLRTNNWPGYAFAAATEWQPAAPTVDHFLDAFANVEYGAPGAALSEVVRLLGWRDLGPTDYTDRAVHRLPRIRLAGFAHNLRMTNLALQMDQAVRGIDRNVSRVLFHRGTLDGMRLAARRFLLYADRELALQSMAEQLGDLEIRDLPAARQRAIVATLTRLADVNRAVIVDFQRLWIDTNRPGALDYNVNRLARQTDEYESLLRQARDGTLRVWKPGQPPARIGEVASSP